MSEGNLATQKVADLQSIVEVHTNAKYPKVVFLIIVNEFCERFSYYGFRTVLYIFFTNFLKIEENTATALYHAFTMLCYFTPILGAILADGYIGLYKTIISLSVFYAIGEAVLTLTSMVPLGAPSLIGPAIGLAMIGFGTGGIKPCVSAFGGNQFLPSQKNYIVNFFSLFYLSINIGSTIGTLLTPIFRSDVKCFQNDCYPLAFGVPAALMLVATLVFAIGTPFYRRDNDKPKGSGNIISLTVGCVFLAIKNRFNSIRKVRNKAGDSQNQATKKLHWLDYANDGTYSIKLISDVKVFCKIMLLYIPLPLFWALYDQQGSRWTSQAQQLNGIIGSVTIKPDQFQAVNPILIVLFVPLFDLVIYPLLAKCGFFKLQLQRMSAGMLLTVIAFLVSAFLEYQMDLSSERLNPLNRIRIVNTSPCRLDFTSLDRNNMFSLVNNIEFLPEGLDKFKVVGTCQKVGGNSLQIDQEISLTDIKASTSLIFYLNVTKGILETSELEYKIKKAKIGSSEVRFSSVGLSQEKLKRLSFLMENKGLEYKNIVVGQVEQEESALNYREMDYGEFQVKVTEDGIERTLGEVLLETCSKYTVLVYARGFNQTIDYLLLTDVHASGVHIGWQLVQILVITFGEIMFSISGLTFSYSEAPQSMKSVIAAMWLLTVAAGNLIVVVIAESRFISNQVYEYILFAGLLLLATILFMVLAYFYEYTPERSAEEDENEMKRIDTTNIDDSTRHDYLSKCQVNPTYDIGTAVEKF